MQAYNFVPILHFAFCILHFISKEHVMNEQPNHNPQSEKPLDEKRKNALFRYIGIMFIVAFLFVLISMLGELRSSEATISQLNQSSTSAIQKAEQLQDNNRRLETDNAYLTGRIEELEKQLADLETELEQQQTDAEALQSQQADEISDLTQQLQEAQEEAAATQSAYELLLQAQAEEGSNAGTLSGLKQYVQYFAEYAKNLYENLTKEGE